MNVLKELDKLALELEGQGDSELAEQIDKVAASVSNIPMIGDKVHAHKDHADSKHGTPISKGDSFQVVDVRQGHSSSGSKAHLLKLKPIKTKGKVPHHVRAPAKYYVKSAAGLPQINTSPGQENDPFKKSLAPGQTDKIVDTSSQHNEHTSKHRIDEHCSKCQKMMKEFDKK